VRSITQRRSLQLSNVPASCRHPEENVHAMRGINSIDPVSRDAGGSQSPGNGVYAAGWRYLTQDRTPTQPADSKHARSELHAGTTDEAARCAAFASMMWLWGRS
jgi:hypothetical protein